MGTKAIKKLCWILIIMFSLFATEIFAKEWNGIVPCVSTRSNVEIILGKDNAPGEVSIYNYKKSRIHVIYETKDINDPDAHIVKKITVYPNVVLNSEKYIKEIPDFHKNFKKIEYDIKITHVYGQAVYRNVTEGFEIKVQKYLKTNEEIIYGFGYFAPDNSCPNLKSDSSESTGIKGSKGE